MPRCEERGLSIFDSKKVQLINISFFLSSPPTIIYGMKRNFPRVAAGQCPPDTGTALLYRRQDRGTPAALIREQFSRRFTDTAHPPYFQLLGMAGRGGRAGPRSPHSAVASDADVPTACLRTLLPTPLCRFSSTCPSSCSTLRQPG